jgi:hypothetical protein
MGAPLNVNLELTPRARVDVIDARALVLERDERILRYPNSLYASFHTTAGYLGPSLTKRLARSGQAVEAYLDVFRACFPEQAGYAHDQLDRRRELSKAQRSVESRNAASHLTFIAAGLRNCVAYVNPSPGSVCFVDLDGLQGGRPRIRRTTVVGYEAERTVARFQVSVPVSRHPVDAVNLKDSRLGIYERIGELAAAHGIGMGRAVFELPAEETASALTVNEYETLLMRHDLADVLRDPLRFLKEQIRDTVADPGAVPGKVLDYAKYDLIRTVNHFVDTLGLSETLVERILFRIVAIPAARFFRSRRRVSLVVAAGETTGKILEGPYQSPILLQWRPAQGRERIIDIILTQFE